MNIGEMINGAIIHNDDGYWLRFWNLNLWKPLYIWISDSDTVQVSRYN